MKKAGISEGLVERTQEIYTETRSKVRIKDETSEEFWTQEEVRQGCPLSPTLFTILIADIEEEM